MNFKEATDALFDGVTHDDLATRLGVSVSTIRQARLGPDAHAHRTPPGDWSDAVVRIAEARITHYRKLVESLRRETKVPARRTIQRGAGALPSVSAAKARN